MWHTGFDISSVARLFHVSLEVWSCCILFLGTGLCSTTTSAQADSTSDNTWNNIELLSINIMLYSCLSIAKPLAASYLPELFSSSESAEQTAVEVESTATDLSSSASSSPASSTIMTHSVVVDILNQITRVRNCARKQMTLTAFIVGGGGVGRRCCVTIEAS